MITALATRIDRLIGADLLRRANRAAQVGIVAALLAGLRRRDPSVVVNGLVSAVFASLPRYLARRFGVRFHPWQRLWISSAALVHTLGMLGPYDRVWWWDHLAHTLSGVVVGGAADVFLRTAAGEAGRPTVPDRSRSVVVVGVTFAFGLLWEILEYAVHAVADRVGFDPLLVHYGRLDVVWDLLFDLLGAGLVVRYGRSALANVVDSVADE